MLRQLAGAGEQMKRQPNQAATTSRRYLPLPVSECYASETAGEKSLLSASMWWSHSQQ